MIFEIKKPEGNYTLEFKSGCIYRYYAGLGKSWPKTTQCIVSKNNMVLGIGQITKHITDEDNPIFARRLCLKIAFKNAKIWKELRIEFFTKLLDWEKNNPNI